MYVLYADYDSINNHVKSRGKQGKMKQSNAEQVNQAKTKVR
jgi:hypothetical protein